MDSEFFWGKTGSGKTLAMVRKGVKQFFTGREIYSNLKSIKIIPYYYCPIRNLVEMILEESPEIANSRPKTILWDEIHTEFDGRKSGNSQNELIRQFVAQLRKFHFNIYYTSVYIVGADVSLRTVTDRMTRCIPILDRNNVGKGDLSTPEPVEFNYYTLSIDESSFKDRGAVVKTRMKRTEARFWYLFYDTYEVIRPSEEYIL